MNRPRSTAKGKGLPPNLYAAGTKAYRYKHPLTGKFHGMGQSKAKAVQAANRLNALLAKDNDLVDRVMACQDKVADYADRWLNEIITERKLSPGTIRAYSSSVKAIKAKWGEYKLDELSTKIIAKGLEGMTRSGAISVRGRLTDILREAASDGLVQDNQAAMTRKKKATVLRKRMTQEQFDAIREHAPAWLQRTMDIALITLQRASDLLTLRFDQVKDGSLYVIQQKTRQHDTGYLKIGMSPELKALISRCRDNTPSPLIIHRVPKHKRKTKVGHWTQVAYPTLQKDFDQARSDCGLFDGWEKGTQPTFHEIRALGIKNYKDRGIDPQQLAGHASEQMTKNYDSRHEDIRWIEIDLGGLHA